MGDAGAAVGSAIGFVSQRISEQEQANQRDIDRMREDAYNQQQQKNWQTQFDYQKELNQTQMEREDNAIQRSVADHQAAGFNKLLAVGNQSAAGGMTTFGGSAGGGVSQHRGGELFSEGNALTTMASQIMDNRVKQSMIAKNTVENNYTAQKTLTEIENTTWTQIKKLRENLAKEKDEYMREYWTNEIEEQIERVNIMRHNLGIGKRWQIPVGSDPTPSNPIEAGFRVLNNQATMGNSSGNESKKGNSKSENIDDKTKNYIQKALGSSADEWRKDKYSEEAIKFRIEKFIKHADWKAMGMKKPTIEEVYELLGLCK